jgi:hypothetical protein
MRRAFLSLMAPLVAATLIGIGAPRAFAGSGDRAATRILDAVPLPATAQPDDLGDRKRSYTSPEDPVTVLEFFRVQLRAAGWTEKSVAQASANNNTLGRGAAEGPSRTEGGAESSGEGTPGSEDAGTGTGSTSNQQLTGPIIGRWTMAGAMLRLRIDAVAAADQQTQGESNRQSTFVLRARLPRSDQ